MPRKLTPFFSIALLGFCLVAARTCSGMRPAPRELAQAPAASPLPTFLSNAADWGNVKAPGAGPVQVYGGYSAGCIQGASTLEWDGVGYHVVRVGQNRYYGHPHLLAFVSEFATDAFKRSLGDLLIGDTAQPRGGPMKTGHASHQIGLDADIWFHVLKSGTAPLPRAERDGLHTYSLVRADGRGIDANAWDARHAEMLRLASTNARVARIFVNPHIKRKVCTLFPNEEWVRRLRPWWGHDTHFHVRLKCPADQPRCQNQEDMPEGNGCGEELAGWFTSDGRVVPPPAQPLEKERVLAMPAECQAVLAAP